MNYIDPSFIMRSIPVNAGDRVNTSFLGKYAVHAAMAGKTGMMFVQVKSNLVHLLLELVTIKRHVFYTQSAYLHAQCRQQIKIFLKNG